MIDLDTSEFDQVLTHDLYYYSSVNGMTERLAEKLPFRALKVPGQYRKKSSKPMVAAKEFVLLAPTYKSERDHNYVPRCLKEFLTTYDNSKLIRGVVGIGNINFGSDYCKSADVISEKFNVPILGKIELAGTPDDVTTLIPKINAVIRNNDKDTGFARLNQEAYFSGETR